MGNENSKNKELQNRNGRIPEKHINGSANGLSANLSSNGLEISANGEAAVQKNGESSSLKRATEPNDFVVVELDGKAADAPVISEILEIVIHKEEVRESEGDQTDVSLPATNLQTESTSSGEEAAAAMIAVHLDSVECPLRKAETSTQTDGTTEADISTQTYKNEEVATTDNEVPVEEAVSMETGSTEEDPLNVSARVIVQDDGESSDNQAARTINEGVVMYENMVFRLERAELDGTESNITAEPGFNPKVSEIEEETVAEENNIGETSASEVYYSFPKVVADCVEVVFADAPQSTGFAAVDSSVLADGVATGDNGEGAGHTSVDAVQTETAKHQSTEARKANAVRSSATALMETISEVVCEAPDPAPADHDAPAEHSSARLAVALLVKAESAHEEVTADDAVATEIVPETPQQAKLDDEPSEKCDSCPEHDIITAEAPNKPAIIEELPVEPERYEEAEPSPVLAKDSAEAMWEAAINALSEDFREESSSLPREAAAAKGLPLIEEVITASTFAGLPGGQEASIAVAEELFKRVTAEALSNATETVAEDATNTGEEPADVPPMDATGEPELCVSVQERLRDENVAPAEVPANSRSLSHLERRPKSSAQIVAMETIEDGAVRQIMHETDTSAVDVSQITTLDEAMSESFDAVLEAIVEEIINEDVFSADGRLVTSDEVSPEAFVEEDAEEDAEKESSVNSSDPTVDSQSVTRTDMEALAETAKQKQGSESLTEPESVTLDSDEGNQEDNNPEENPVMNFFKSLTTSKITKKETAAPVAIKDQSQKENQPAATTTVAQVSEPPAAPKGMSIPPPPPPEPPKMDIKAEPAAKPVKATPREEAKAVAKQPQSSKGKSATLSKFFRSKTNKESPPKPDIEVDVQQVVEVEETPVEAPEPVVLEVKSENNVDPHDSAEQVAQPVVQEQKVDSSKAGTLEAAAKPEPPPPVQEAQKTASTSSFFSLFKPKVLLDHMTTKVQAASTSGVRLLGRTTGVAADPKKASPAPAAAPETVKAKEEPKAAAKLSEAVVDNKPASVASQAAGDAAKAPKKLEKRNSIHQFFKILGQKRNSTDAGIQTETLAVAPVPEKVK